MTTTLKQIEVRDPFTNEIYQTFLQSSSTEIQLALQNGHDYYQEALSHDISERAKQLQQLATVFLKHQDELATVAAHNMGKRLSEGQNEVAAAANIAHYFADHGAEFLTNKPYQSDGLKAHLTYMATGIVLAVEPWNFPYTQVMRVFAPNFILGNPIILKHAGITAGCAALFESLVAEAGIPNGAFKNLFLDHQQVNDIIADDRVQGVALTGSETAGRQIAAAAGQHLKKSTLELGGSDALIVLGDADIQSAVEGATISRLRNAGQVCTSAKRYIVRREIADAFVEGLQATFTNQIIGDPLDPLTTMAPLSSKSAQRILQEQVETAVSAGAHVLIAGGAVPETNFFLPMLLTNISSENPAFNTEFFGPVAQLYLVDSDEEAIQLANATSYGLAGAVYSQDIAHAQHVAQRMITGQVFINQPSIGVPQLPFGGVKHSGYGREMSDLGIYEFANQKIIVK